MPGKLIEDQTSSASDDSRVRLAEFALMLRSTERVRLAVRRCSRVPAPDDLVLRLFDSLEPRRPDLPC